jgi:glutamate N-acetyltransferase/amino-acid N-acetyltransferase
VWSAIKGSGKPDLSLIVSERIASAAGVFTTNLFRAAPVWESAGRLAESRGRARAIVATSGNSNSLTGAAGIRDSRAVSREAARLLAIPEKHVLIASTGTMGRRLPVDRVKRGLRKAVRALGNGPESGLAAACGILTTDTRPKEAVEKFTAGSAECRVGGCAKGVGMVSPNMATILVFLTTDAEVAPVPLKAALKAAVGSTFNAITVDGQMSTNDTAFLLANGAASGRSLAGRGLNVFTAALTQVCRRLARELVRDGEGASRTFRVIVRRARTAREAERAARAVADSALVKTMFYGRQPNWGRIAQALGACGARFDPVKITVRVGGAPAIRGGMAVEPKFDMLTRLADPEVQVEIDLAAGRGEASILTCDLTERYVKINAGYLS